jgi:hypothetical protein
MVSEKLKLLQEAERNGNHAAGRKYHTNEICVR